jgi:hypothetical protein
VNTTGIDYYIMLRAANSSSIMVVVSFEANISSYFVSYIKIDASGQQTANAAAPPPSQPPPTAITNNLQPS